MKLHIIDGDIQLKQRRLADIQRKATEEAAKGTRKVNLSISAFCEHDHHSQCTWAECKCTCHKFESAMNESFSDEWCGHC